MKWTIALLMGTFLLSLPFLKGIKAQSLRFGVAGSGVLHLQAGAPAIGTGAVATAWASYCPNERFSIQTGLGYQQLSGINRSLRLLRTDHSEGQISRQIQVNQLTALHWYTGYLTLTTEAWPSRRWNLSAGLYASRLHQFRALYFGGQYKIDPAVQQYEFARIENSLNVEGQISRFDWGLKAGIRYELTTGLYAQLGIRQGLVDLFPTPAFSAGGRDWLTALEIGFSAQLHYITL